MPPARPSPSQEMSFFPALPPPLGIAVTTAPPNECPYLPGRASVTRGFRCENMPGWLYQDLMDAGFRRSGDVFYQPACRGCRACVAIRIPVNRFRLSKGQRRLWKRNQDLTLTFGRPALTAEKNRLYLRYLDARHNGQMSGDGEELEDFLYRSPTETIEVCYRSPDDVLVGVGICDITPGALSSVYFYFDPEAGGRGVGIFSCLAEIQVARSLGLAYYYPGFWVAECPKMQYKERLRPSELLCTDGQWRPFEAAATSSGQVARPTGDDGAAEP